MHLNKINLNSDIAEKDLSFFETVDALLINKISSANLSCLYHGGSEDVVFKALNYCKTKHVSVGAHTLITKNIKNPGNFIGIMPAQNHVNWSKSAVFIKKRGK